MYAPTLGRFLSRDPLPLNGEPDILFDNNWFGERMTLMRNLYGYDDSNPVNVTDPIGLVPALAPIGIAAGTGAAATGGAALVGAAPAALMVGAAVGGYSFGAWLSQYTTQPLAKWLNPIPEELGKPLPGAELLQKVSTTPDTTPATDVCPRPGPKPAEPRQNQRKKCKLIASGECVGKKGALRRKKCTYDCGPDGQVVTQIDCPPDRTKEPACRGADGGVVEL